MSSTKSVSLSPNRRMSEPYRDTMTANPTGSGRNTIASQDGKRPNLMSTKFLDAKENRKKVEMEYQSLLARIIKLEEEEAKAKRKIVQAKRQKSILEEKRSDVSKRMTEKSIRQSFDSLNTQEKQTMILEEKKRKSTMKEQIEALKQSKRQEAEMVKKHTEKLFSEMQGVRDELTKRYFEDAKMTNMMSQQKRQENRMLKENMAKQANRERRQSKELNETEVKQLRDELLKARQQQAENIRSQRKRWEEIQDMIETEKKGKIFASLQSMMRMEESDARSSEESIKSLLQRELGAKRRLEKMTQTLEKIEDDLQKLGASPSTSPSHTRGNLSATF